MPGVMLPGCRSRESEAGGWRLSPLNIEHRTLNFDGFQVIACGQGDGGGFTGSVATEAEEVEEPAGTGADIITRLRHPPRSSARDFCERFEQELIEADADFEVFQGEILVWGMGFCIRVGKAEQKRGDAEGLLELLKDRDASAFPEKDGIAAECLAQGRGYGIAVG